MNNKKTVWSTRYTDTEQAREAVSSIAKLNNISEIKIISYYISNIPLKYEYINTKYHTFNFVNTKNLLMSY